MEGLLPLLALATLGSLAGILGGAALLFKKEWTSALSSWAIPFAAGVLLSVALLDILPEAVHEADPEVVFPTVLVVMIAAFLIKGLFLNIHYHDFDDTQGGKKKHLRFSLPLVVFGDTIHNFIDGVAIAAAYLVEPALGFIVAFSTFLHETPHEIGDFGLMLAGGWTKLKAITINALSALATFPGALMVFWFSDALERYLGIMLAIAGGIFLYIATSDLIPEIKNGKGRKSWEQIGFFLAGVLVMWLVSELVPHAEL